MSEEKLLEIIERLAKVETFAQEIAQKHNSHVNTIDDIVQTSKAADQRHKEWKKLITKDFNERKKGQRLAALEVEALTSIAESLKVIAEKLMKEDTVKGIPSLDDVIADTKTDRHKTCSKAKECGSLCSKVVFDCHNYKNEKETNR